MTASRPPFSITGDSDQDPVQMRGLVMSGDLNYLEDERWSELPADIPAQRSAEDPSLD